MIGIVQAHPLAICAGHTRSTAGHAHRITLFEGGVEADRLLDPARHRREGVLTNVVDLSKTLYLVLTIITGVDRHGLAVVRPLPISAAIEMDEGATVGQGEA